MKIYGVGVDIIENSRIKKLIKKKIFLRRIFSKAELKITKTKNNKISFLAKRFSAKEAFVKSLGSGFRNNLCFNEHDLYKLKVRAILKAIGNYVYNNLKSNKILISPPQGAFYLMPEFKNKKYKTSPELCEALIAESNSL